MALFIEGGVMDLNSFSEILKVLLQIANVVVLGYALYKFLNKPHSTLETKHEELVKRVNAHDVEIREIKEILRQRNDRDKEQENTNEILLRCTFALLEFEVHYCETEQKPISKNLEKAKDDLHDYLARK